jgi:hypothetical protein
MAKKKPARAPKMAIDANVPPALSPGLSILKLMELLSAPELKAMLLNCRTIDLKRYVNEIAGQEPHPTQDDSSIIKHLCKWIDGDKNWMYAPNMPTNGTRRPSADNNTAHTHEEGEMKNTATAKKNGTTKREIKKLIEVPKEATKTLKAKKGKVAPKVEAKGKKANGKGMRKPDGTIMLNPWSERTAWFRKAISEAKETKRTDEQIMSAAEKEFGKGNIGSGPWTVSKQRAKIRNA